MNIVWNGTGKNLNKYRKLMAEAKSKGYTTELRYIWVPFALALDRVHRRASMIGRTVPKKVLEYANKQIPETFKRLRIETDYARIYSNMVISPSMIWDKDQGWHDYTPRRRKSISETVLSSKSKSPAN
jgi:predicted ABC-type ATPase